MSRIVRAGEWLEKYGRVCKEGKVGIAVGKRCGGRVSDIDGGGGWMYYALDREVVAEREVHVVWRSSGWIWVPSPL